MSISDYRLSPNQIDYYIQADKVQKLDGAEWGRQVIGQPRALEALTMGTAIRAKGYNVFVTGSSGTGRRTTVMQVLSRYTPAELDLRDIFYVYNFATPHVPKALSLPAGQARMFKKELHNFIENIKKLITMQTESADYKKQKTECTEAWDNEENSRLASFEAELAIEGFQVVQLQTEEGQTATDILPLLNGTPVSFEEIQDEIKKGNIDQERFEQLREKYFTYMDKMKLLFVDLKRGRKQLDEKLDNLRRSSIRPLIHSEIQILSAHHEDEKVNNWIQELEQDVLNHLYLFSVSDQSDTGHAKAGRTPLSRYGINILSSHKRDGKVPVIFESALSYINLFGTIEISNDAQSDHKNTYLKIRPGSLVRASGGFLVLQAEDLMQDEECWHALKRVLRSGRLEIQTPPGPFVNQSSIKPEALEIDVKVVIIGGEMVYDILYQNDPEFRKLFKIHAEFDATMPLNDDTIRDYIAFIRKITREEELREASPSGIAAAINYGIRLAEHKHRLSTTFSQLADLLREADYRAAIEGRKEIDAAAINKSIQTRSWLSDMPEEKLAEMIVAGEIILKVEGECVGRVNGLAVHDRGYYAFGLPAVISAQVAPGESGVINIEGESGLSGEIYDKAVLIVEGFLRSRYARTFPLNVAASICFEQSYSAVEGDSASSTAVYALLSAISGIPLRQDIAVTGSVNQMGQIQTVGGVSEKVEGFYRICKKAGFTKTQGVMIPKQNIVNLVLSPEVLQAVHDGSFSIYAVSTIDEGLEVLTGKAPGIMLPNKTFEADSFNSLVAKELYEMSKSIKVFSSL